MKKQVELSITHNGKDVVAYPYSKKEHVQFENGMNIDEFVGQDIATPTITHDTTAIKVGVGDSDVSGSVVDGTVNMTIKGQTYQNILPEPSLRNKMIGKSMQRLNEGYDNIEVVDGVSKSAILSGNTLVNLIKKLTPENYGDNKEWRVQGGSSPTHICNSDGSITATGTIKGSMVLDYYNLTLFKPNTEYTLFVSVDWNGVGIAPRLSKISTNDISLNNGLNIVKFTTVSDLTVQYMAFRLGYSGELPIGCEYTFNNIMVIEGDHTQEDIPYFTGMQSVKMPVLQTYDGNIMRLSPPQHTTNGVTVEKINDVEFLFNQGSRQGIGGWKWNIPNGEAFTLSFHYEKVSGCENQCQVHVSCAGGISDKFDLSEQFGDFEKTFYVRRTTPTLVEFKPVGEITSTKSVLKISNLKWYIGNKVYSDKTNILSTPEEVVLRSLPNGVKDTLNCMTGEYVQRIGEYVITGDEPFTIANAGSGLYRLQISNPTFLPNIKCGSTICDKLKGLQGNDRYLHGNSDGKTHYIGYTSDKWLRLVIDETITTVQQGKDWLSGNLITFQYELAEPIVKTVDLSSSGNWEKVVLDGSENWSMTSESSNNNAFFRGDNTVPNNVKVNSNNLAQKVICDILTPFTQDQICNKPNDFYGISLGWNDSNLCVRHKDFPLTNEGLTQWKQYLQQNPVTVWYQTTTTQDNSIREMLSFANGHLQVSNEAENSLLPSVQYEIPTKNSYHMDLMKTNTLYTMKAKSVSGTFTIDGTSYNVNANGAFTSPSSMTDKLLIMSNKTNEEVMLLEGNVIDKTIPYFKGIKSAFEGEDKIEVLSTGKNLFDGRLVDGFYNNANFIVAGDTKVFKSVKLFCKAGRYVISFSKKVNIVRLLKENTYSIVSETNINTYSFTVNKDSYCGISFRDATSVTTVWDDNTLIQIEETQSPTTYEPYKSNSTKIPLLSPLRSLPNGVCDEIILDRENNKAKIIQRVGKVILDGSENWGYTPDWVKGETIGFYLLNDKSNGFCLSDKFIFYHGINSVDHECVSFPKNAWLGVRIKVDKLGTQDVDGFKQYLQQNPLTVYYDLATPIVTEIDLEGYPYVYKDGHIFLNSEVAPTTEIIYSINQAQQIESANENLQRHEKEISHLQKLIAQYIQVEYESTLLSLKI